MSLEKELVRLGIEVSTREAEIERLKSLKRLFPRLDAAINRHKDRYLFTQEVNAVVTAFDLGNKCSCCYDADFVVRPYVQTEYGKVYSDPYQFTIGVKSLYFNTPNKGWKEILLKHEISQSIIDQVSEALNLRKVSILQDVSQSFEERDPFEGEVPLLQRVSPDSLDPLRTSEWKSTEQETLQKAR